MARTKADYEEIGATRTGGETYKTIAELCKALPQTEKRVNPMKIEKMGIVNPSYGLLDDINAYMSYISGRAKLPLTKKELLGALKDLPDDAIVYADGCSQCTNAVTGISVFNGNIVLEIDEE